MLRILSAATVALLMFTNPMLAETKEKTKIKPGTEATEELGKEVPTMKVEECAEKTQKDAAKKDTNKEAANKKGIEPGTEITKEIGEEVPTMTATAEDCTPEDKG